VENWECGRKGTCGAGGYLILMYYHEGVGNGEGNAIHAEGMAVLAVVLVSRVWRLECGRLFLPPFSERSGVLKL
jgi:hypothetical protein